MKRRTFLAATAGLSLAAPAFAAPKPYERFLGAGWQVPRATVLEVWPADVNLDIAGMLTAVEEWTIPSDSQLVIRLKDGEHVQMKTLAIRHPHGNRLAIVGNKADAGKVRIQWSGTDDGLYVGAGYVLGLLDGVTLEHTAPQTRGNGSAVLADEGGVIMCGTQVRARNFYYGFQARIGGVIRCSGTESQGGGDANYFAFNGGHIIARNAKATGARDEKKKLGSGFVAEYGGTIDAVGAVADFNYLAGFTALSDGAIRAYDSSASHNGQAGYYANTGGRIVAHRAVARANCGAGVLAPERPADVSGVGLVNQANQAGANTCVAF
jgi:hypothetical protein